MPKLTAQEFRDFRASPKGRALAAEHAELIRKAKPLYVEMLCSLPFYEARRHDDRFWNAYIGSRYTAAQALVASTERG